MIKDLGWVWTHDDDTSRKMIEISFDFLPDRPELAEPLLENYMLKSVADRWVVLDKKDVDTNIYYSLGNTPINFKPIVDVRAIIGYIRSINYDDKTAKVVLSTRRGLKAFNDGELMNGDKVLTFMGHTINHKGKPPVLVEIYYAYLTDREDEANDNG